MSCKKIQSFPRLDTNCVPPQSEQIWWPKQKDIMQGAQPNVTACQCSTASCSPLSHGSTRGQQPRRYVSDWNPCSTHHLLGLHRVQLPNTTLLVSEHSKQIKWINKQAGILQRTYHVNKWNCCSALWYHNTDRLKTACKKINHSVAQNPREHSAQHPFPHSHNAETPTVFPESLTAQSQQPAAQTPFHLCKRKACGERCSSLRMDDKN